MLNRLLIVLLSLAALVVIECINIFRFYHPPGFFIADLMLGVIVWMGLMMVSLGIMLTVEWVLDGDRSGK